MVGAAGGAGLGRTGDAIVQDYAEKRRQRGGRPGALPCARARG
eukprot:gene31130-53253_t